PWCNEAERLLIEGRVGSAQREPVSVGIKPSKSVVGAAHPMQLLMAALNSRELRLISVMGVAVNVGWVFLVTWLPRFLIARHGAELETYVKNPEVFTGMLTALAGLGGMVGSLIGGTAADLFLAAYGRKWGRRLPGLTAGFVACGLYLIAMQLTNVWLL